MAPKSRPVNTSRKEEYRQEGCSPSGGVPLPERSDGLPCLYNNNSIETILFDDSDFQVASLAGLLLNSYQKMQAHSLYSNTERLISLAPSLGHVAFFTLTFPDKVFTYKEACRRWNSLNNNYLRKHPEFGEWIRVGEQHLDDSWHFHCLVIMAKDIRDGFDFDIFAQWLDDYKRTKIRKRLKTGSSYLRSLWLDLRENLQKYGFGRSELVPIRSNAEAMARYVGKYISKHISQRSEKGVRLIAYSRGWTKNSVKATFFTPGSKEWRRKTALFAQLHGCTEDYQVQNKLGHRWRFKYSQDIYDVDRVLLENGGTLPTAEHQDNTLTRIEENRQSREIANRKDPNLISRKSDYQKRKDQAKAVVSLLLMQELSLPEITDPEAKRTENPLDDRTIAREWAMKLNPEPKKPEQPPEVPF